MRAGGGERDALHAVAHPKGLAAQATAAVFAAHEGPTPAQGPASPSHAAGHHDPVARPAPQARAYPYPSRGPS